MDRAKRSFATMASSITTDWSHRHTKKIPAEMKSLTEADTVETETNKEEKTEAETDAGRHIKIWIQTDKQTKQTNARTQRTAHRDKN